MYQVGYVKGEVEPYIFEYPTPQKKGMEAQIWCFIFSLYPLRFSLTTDTHTKITTAKSKQFVKHQLLLNNKIKQNTKFDEAQKLYV